MLASTGKRRRVINARPRIVRKKSRRKGQVVDGGFEFALLEREISIKLVKMPILRILRERGGERCGSLLEIGLSELPAAGVNRLFDPSLTLGMFELIEIGRLVATGGHSGINLQFTPLGERESFRTLRA